jgi:PAS domain S-box-containing protein
VHMDLSSPLESKSIRVAILHRHLCGDLSSLRCLPMKTEGLLSYMFANLLEYPKLFRHLVEDLPMGIYIVDRERYIRFWNHGAEHITGHLAHEVVGHLLDDVVQACDREGNRLSGEERPVTMTIQEREPRQCTVFYLHKGGHRVAVTIRTRPILEYGDTIGGASVLFEEAFVDREGTSPLPMYGCLDPLTAIPSRRLTRAVMYECMAGMKESRIGFGLLRVRILGLDEFRSAHGPQSATPFLRAAAHTLRHGLDAESFLGCWDKNEFLAVLTSASPMIVAMTAETLWNLLSHSEASWWGDRFLLQAEVAYTVAAPGDDLETLLREMKPSHSSGIAKAATASAGHVSDSPRG